MATNPASTQTPQRPADHHDEHTGVYGFFRRHQKKLLYTAGLFTLLTFSVTGPMMTAVESLFSGAREQPSIVVNGKRVELEPEDFQYGNLIARYMGALPPVMPVLGYGEGGENERADNLAILRRAAIAEGIDVSMDEVDRAIEVERETHQIESAVQLARYRQFGSLAHFRDVVREAMRIGTYVRLQTLALDTSEAKVLEQILGDRKKITFRVASFDEAAYETELKAQTTLAEDELRAWFDGKSEPEKARMQAYDSNHLELQFGAVLLAEGQFDPSQWQDSILKDFAPAEDTLRALYDQEKELRWENEAGDGHLPFEDVQPQVLRLAQADQVANHLLGEVRKAQEEIARTANDELSRCRDELQQATNAFQELEAKDATTPEETARRDEELRLAKEIVTAKRNAVDVANEAVRAVRAGFDFAKAWQDATQDKSGCELRAMSGRRRIEDLEDLDAAGVDLGKWPRFAQARGVTAKGDLGTVTARTSKALALYFVTDIEVRPLKPWDELRPLIEGAWFTEKAKAHGEERRKALEEALLRLAKEQIPDKVAEIEGTRATRIDERLAEWEKTTNDGIAEAQQWLERVTAGTQAQVAWQRKLDTLQQQLAAKDARRTAIETEVTTAIEAEIAEEAKKRYGDVLDAAAAEAGFTVATVGPHPRELSQRPRFDKAYDATTVFLFRSHSALKVGETTGVVQNATERVWLCAVCTAEAPLDVSDVTRREFESLRTGDGYFSFARQQAMNVYQQAFTKEALTKRYEYVQPRGTQEAN